MNTIHEILKKPIKLVLENNIHEDVVFPDTTIAELVNKIHAKVTDPDLEVYLSALFVYTDKSADNKYVPKAMITSREAIKFAELVTEHLDSGKHASEPISVLNLETHFPIKFQLSDSDEIEEATRIFKSGLTDVIIIVNSTSEYIGKLKRENFTEKLKMLLN